MSNQLDFIHSLKIGDIVIIGHHIGAIRYLGPIEGVNNDGPCIYDASRIYELYAGIELTEPCGHMNGSMEVHGKTVKYFDITYGAHMNRVTQTNAKYGVLVPVVAIQRKIDSFSLLIKLTTLFQEYKRVNRSTGKLAAQQHSQQSQLHSQSQGTTTNEIRTNSDLESPAYSTSVDRNLRKLKTMLPVGSTYAAGAPVAYSRKMDNEIRFHIDDDDDEDNNDRAFFPSPTHSNQGQGKPPWGLRKVKSESHLSEPHQPYYGDGRNHHHHQPKLPLKAVHSQPKPKRKGNDSHRYSRTVHQRRLLVPTDMQLSSPQSSAQSATMGIEPGKQPLNSSLPSPHSPHSPAVYPRTRGYSAPHRNDAMQSSRSRRDSIPPLSQQTIYHSHSVPKLYANASPPTTSVGEQPLIKPAADGSSAATKTDTKPTSPKSDASLATLKTARSGNRGSGHHASSSMFTHAPLNCWNDMRSGKLTSSSTSAEKDQDLSSLAKRIIRVSSPRHNVSASANSLSGMSMHGHGHGKKDSQQLLKELLTEFKNEKQRNDKSKTPTNKNRTDPSMLTLKESAPMDNDDGDSPVADVSQLTLRDVNTMNTTVAMASSPPENVLDNQLTLQHVFTSPEEKLAEVENNEEEKLQFIESGHEHSDLDICTPIPTPSIASFNAAALTEHSLRRHNSKRRLSQDQSGDFPADEAVKCGIKTFGAGRIPHVAHRTLSAPMLPKFDLMMCDQLSSEEEKSGSSDGDDTQSLGMDTFNACDHTTDITDDDPQLVQSSPQSKTARQKASKPSPLTQYSFAADSISRRSSVQLTLNGALYSPSIQSQHDSSPSMMLMTADNPSTPQHFMLRKNAGPGNNSSTPTYSSYKTKHEYLQDMNYYSLLQRAQQLRKSKTKNKQKAASPTPAATAIDDSLPSPEQTHLSIAALGVIQESYDFANSALIELNDSRDAIESKPENESIKHFRGHHKSHSCDTHTAMKDEIEPYTPPDEETEQAQAQQQQIAQSALV